MKIEQLESLARTTVGDGQAPQLFFVSTKSHGIVTVSRSFAVAYEHWKNLARHSKSLFPTLEDRLFGTIASVELAEENSGPYVVCDDSTLYLARHTVGIR